MQRDILAAAQAFHERGWCVLPVGTNKRPALRAWKKYQTERPTTSQVRKWFRNGNVGVAVVLGDISGGLICRDFDVLASYRQWQATHPDLADTLPTSRTGRGAHVFLRSEHRGIVYLDDGELRGAGIAVLPPSKHSIGVVYRWIVPLSNSVPTVSDPTTIGLGRLDVTDENGREPTRTEKNSRDGLVVDDTDSIEKAISSTLPEGAGQRHFKVFELARRLKGLPSLADADPVNLEEIVRAWHRRALSKIRTKEFDETWIDFLHGWERVRSPAKENLMTDLLERARAAPMLAIAERYDSGGIRLLVALCRELHREAGKRPFFLACSTVAELFNVSKMTASRWLYLLERHQVIEIVIKGGTAEAPRKATRYLFVGGQPVADS